MKSDIKKINLNKNLIIFFKDAAKISLSNPSQAFSFVRTIMWLIKAARIRASWKKQDVLIPPIIIFSITNQCNLECKGCYAQSFHYSSQEEMSDEKLRSITEEAKDLGVSFFVIAGGEPLKRPEFFNITKDFPEIIFLIFTNGLLIDEDMINKFRNQKNVVPLISLEGYEKDTDDRRGKGTFEVLQKTMVKMNKESIFWGTSLTLTKPTFSTLIDHQFIEQYVKIGCKFFLFIEYTPTTEGTEDWVLTDEQRGRVPDLMKSFREKYPSLFIAVPWDEEDVGGCLSAGRGFIHINASGDLEPCPFAPFSETNLRDSSLKDALQSEFFSRIRKIPELSRETGGGCILWKERELVQSLMDDESKRKSYVSN